MKLLVQRVSRASVKIDGKEISKIKNGFLVFIGITHGDTKEITDYLVKKLLGLRLFEDENSKLNLSLKDVISLLITCIQGRVSCLLYWVSLLPSRLSCA